MGTSLALYRQTVSPQGPSDRCPNRLGWVLRNRMLGEVIPASCGRVSKCWFCAVKRSRLVSLALFDVAPERMVLLTDAGPDWATIRNRLKRLTWRMRDAGYEWNVVSFVHANPRGTGNHVHQYQHGEFAPQRLLDGLAHREGMGLVRIRQFTANAPRALSYGMKHLTAAIGYGMRDAAATEVRWSGYMTINGKRLFHASSRLWRDADGVAVAGVQAAINTALERRYGPRVGRWELEPELVER